MGDYFRDLIELQKDPATLVRALRFALNQPGGRQKAGVALRDRLADTTVLDGAARQAMTFLNHFFAGTLDETEIAVVGVLFIHWNSRKK